MIDDEAILREALYTKRPLRFRGDGGFRVLMVSDIHGGIGYNRRATVAALDALIKYARPDLVLLGGDIAGPGQIHIENTEQLRSLLDGLAAPMEGAGIPWAHVFGNHDNNFGCENDCQEAVYESYPCCVSKRGTVSGCANYVLPVYDSRGEKIRFNVFGLDTHRNQTQYKRDMGLPPQLETVLPCRGGIGGGEAGLNMDQVMWYMRASALLERHSGGKIPALMVMHEPLPEAALVAMNKEICCVRGVQDEPVSCPALNSGMFRACLERGDVKGIFFGHDHENDFCGEYCGILLGFDGFLSYHACQREDIRGGRVFDISLKDPWRIDTHMVRVKDAMKK